jgi:hypothetical protein
MNENFLYVRQALTLQDWERVVVILLVGILSSLKVGTRFCEKKNRGGFGFLLLIP